MDYIVQTVLDHLLSDLIYSPLVKHLLKTSTAIWLREFHFWGLTAAGHDVYIHRVWGLLDLYDAHERAPSSSHDLQTAGCNPRLFQQRSHPPEIDEAGRRLKAAHCGKAIMNPNLP